MYYGDVQGMDSSTPKREREDMMRVHKETLSRQMRDEEFRLEKHHKNHLDFSVRRFKRHSILSFHSLEQRLLKEVSGAYTVCLLIGCCGGGGGGGC